MGELVIKILLILAGLALDWYLYFRMMGEEKSRWAKMPIGLFLYP